MDEVLQMMMVRSIKERPVLGSISSGNSRSVSTTSPALSPQAARITMSTSALRLVTCCRTVLPAPKGPGMQYVPPLLIGKKVSMMRVWVTIGSKGRSLSA